MSIIDDYFDIKNKIIKPFKHQYLPLEDHRKDWWMIVDEKLIYNNFPFDEKDFGSDGGQFWESDIYSNDLLEEYVYYIDDFTIVTVDMLTDGQGSLIVLSNSLECKNEDLKKLYKEFH